MEKLDKIIFYNLEKSIKTYRQYAQKQITNAGFDITIDQWLILQTIQENAEYSQQQIAEKVFKDFASVTRMIELLVKKGLLERAFHEEDRRRFRLTITQAGIKIIADVQPIIQQNRKQALQSFSEPDIEVLRKYLITLINNCQ
ncbi:MAG: MarR family transcriptional regulator [Runella slithyformis]|nr:MAG: MarR family transcriptional regulator [Runella slithyformis]